MLFGKPLFGGDGSTYEVDVTISSASVASDLTDFPLYIDLSDMPSGFWAHTRLDGGDIRVEDSGGAELPIDLVRFDPFDEVGALVVKTDLSSSSNTVLTVTYGRRFKTAPAAADAIGRHAVWSDYAVVFTAGDSDYNRADSAKLDLLEGDPQFFTQQSVSMNVGAHQGVAADRDKVTDKIWTIDTDEIKRWPATVLTGSPSAEDTFSSVTSSVGSAGVAHLGDAVYHDGKLYVIASDYPTSTESWLVTITATGTMAIDSSVNISSYGNNISGLCWKDGELVGVEWHTTGSATLRRINPATGAQIGTITMDRSLPRSQGIEWWRGAFWIASDEYDEVIRVDEDGTMCAPSQAVPAANGMFGENVAGGNFEGICAYGDRLLVLTDPDGLSNGVVRAWKIADVALGGGATHTAATHVQFEGLTGGTVFSMGVSFKQASAVQKALLTFRDLSSGATNDFASIVIDDGNSLGVYDDVNSWLYCSPAFDPGLTLHRANVVYNGATERRIYADGGNANTDSTITARDAGFDALAVGFADDSYTEVFVGDLGFAYLRMSALSADWIAAENDNLSAPASFYSVGAESAV